MNVLEKNNLVITEKDNIITVKNDTTEYIFERNNRGVFFDKATEVKFGEVDRKLCSFKELCMLAEIADYLNSKNQK